MYSRAKKSCAAKSLDAIVRTYTMIVYPHWNGSLQLAITYGSNMEFQPNNRIGNPCDGMQKSLTTSMTLITTTWTRMYR